MHITQLVSDRSPAASLDALLADFITMTRDIIRIALRSLEKPASLMLGEGLEVTP